MADVSMGQSGKKMPQVHEQVKRLENITERLSDQVTTLRDRLATVLLPDPSAQGPEQPTTKTPERIAELPARLFAIGNKLDVTSNLMTATLRQLEV